MDQLKIKITNGNIKNGHFYIPTSCTIFPTTSWGGKNKSEMGSKFSVSFEGTGETIMTDIDGSKRILRMSRGQTSRFYKKHHLSEGDIICITREEGLRFKVSISC
ncbi:MULTISPECIES: hypothetical protein [unclassified Photobacterium]|uniref:hypothetical protein n=1 Tax=unclassified Photobacterium TaxID=2628852 RepID=UPI001EE0577C|nr:MULTISPECIES: hypothetical protein [unclassified Photobacterium]MCG3865797.1 hypothetical protein [Photobacterium sp. Ph6]MCG3877272.1 hypothetical protein [Photobacterium sp. Ph5]